jgi:Tfp pilus assembly PilM family ATPase
MSIFDSFRAASTPGTAVEIASHRVAAASLESSGGNPIIVAHATEPLKEGSVVPSLTAANVHDRAAVVAALNRVFDRIGGHPRRVSLVVPDLVAKVSLVRFEQVPDRAQDLDQLVRWQVRKTAPFPIDDAQVSHVPGQRSAEGQDFIVSLARREIVQEYEGLCAEVGAHAGIVDLATFNVINAILAGAIAQGYDPAVASDWLLVNVAPDYASIAIVRGEHLIFFRNRSADGDGTLADLVHQTAMYYEDRLNGGGFGQVFLAGASGTGRQASDVEQVRRSLEERLKTAVHTVDPRAAASMTDRISAAPALLDTLAPLVGVLLRDSRRRAARSGPPTQS